MKQPYTFIRQALAGLLTTTALLLAACGGGGGSAPGVGSGGTGTPPPSATINGVRVGTVTGFGSVFVDGVRCNDDKAKVSIDTFTGSPEDTKTSTKLGQRVEVQVDPANAAACTLLALKIEPSVVGVVTSTSPLTVAGRVITINTDTSTAPATVFEGYDNAAGIQVGDRIEAHGVDVPVGNTMTLQATRIERKPLSDQWVRAAGVISGLAGNQFTLGTLTVKTDSNTTIEPAGTVLANGQSAVVWSTAAAAGDGSITAKVVRVKKTDLVDKQSVRIDGAVLACSGTPCTSFTVGGLTVDISSATFVKGTLTDIINGRYISIEGTYDLATAKVTVTKVTVRKLDGTEQGEDTQLIGVVADFVSKTAFSVRGVAVTTDANTVFSSGCTLSNGQAVGLRGKIYDSKVLAARIDCLNIADGLTVDIFGKIVNLDTTAKTFNLSEGPYKTYPFTYSDDTNFVSPLTAATLANDQRVGVHAVLTNGKLVVKKIAADDVPTAPPGSGPLFGNSGRIYDLTSTSLTVNKIKMDIVDGITQKSGHIENGALVRTWFFKNPLNDHFIALWVKVVSED